MTFATLPAAYATSINLARQYSNDADRKKVKKELFACVKETFGIPPSIKLRVACEAREASSPDYLILKNAADNSKFPLDSRGKWTGVAAPAPAPVAQPRWFLIDEDQGLSSLAYDEFSDGDSAKPSGTDFKYGAYPATSLDGNIYVQLTEAQLRALDSLQ